MCVSGQCRPGNSRVGAHDYALVSLSILRYYESCITDFVGTPVSGVTDQLGSLWQIWAWGPYPVTPQSIKMKIVTQLGPISTFTRS